MNDSETLPVEVFRAGDYGPRGSYSAEDLQQIARDYHPARHEAPVTLDHEQSGPAHGWVAGLRAAGGRLYALIGRLSPALRQALSAGAFRKRSIELYRAFDATGGRPYLKAVSFLGAAAPAVKGMEDAAFSEQGAPPTRALGVVRFEAVDPAVPEAPAPAAPAAAPDPCAVLQQRGRWRPEWDAAGLPAVFAALPAGGPERAALLRVLEDVPPPVPFGETARAAAAPGADVHFAEPTHATPDSAARHRRVLDVLARNPGLTYRDALLRVG